MRRLLALLPACALFAAEPAAPAPATPSATSAEESAAPEPGVNATPEALAAALKKAFDARDAVAWKNQVQTAGLTPEELRALDRTLTELFVGQATLRDLTVDTLHDGFEATWVAAGAKHTHTIAPAHLLGVLTLRIVRAKSTAELTLPYGRVGDTFKLAAIHAEKLPAGGPPDTRYSVEIRHTGDPAEVAVRIRYNASGVKLEKSVSGRIAVIPLTARHIDSVELERGGDTGETELRIRREITPTGWSLDYTSEKLSAPGRLVYEREFDTPAAPATPEATAPAPAH